MKIDKEATHDKCRERYGSVAATARAYEVNIRVFYAAIAGTRGVTGCECISTKVIDRLKREGLLVEKVAQ